MSFGKGKKLCVNFTMYHSVIIKQRPLHFFPVNWHMDFILGQQGLKIVHMHLHGEPEIQARASILGRYRLKIRHCTFVGTLSQDDRNWKSHNECTCARAPAIQVGTSIYGRRGLEILLHLCWGPIGKHTVYLTAP